MNAPTPTEVQLAISTSHPDAPVRPNVMTVTRPHDIPELEVERTLLFFDEDREPIVYALVNVYGGRDVDVREWNVTTVSHDAPMAAVLRVWGVGSIGNLGNERLLLTNIDGGEVPTPEQLERLFQFDLPAFGVDEENERLNYERQLQDQANNRRTRLEREALLREHEHRERDLKALRPAWQSNR